MSKKSVKVNYIYNLIYQIFAILTPLITTPYLSRVLGSSGIGQYSFTYSIATYFILFGAFGFGYYAQREIARFQDNKFEQSKIFWEIFIARLLFVSFSSGVYIALILFGIYDDEYSILMWLLLINVFATAFDINFIFQGNEEFGTIAIRNIFVKLIGVISIFIFVKSVGDVWIYALCQGIILIVSNLSLWTRLPSIISPIKFRDLNVKRHILPSFKLFIPTIAVSVYTMLDKTLIGILVPGTVETVSTNGEIIIQNISDIENGYYEQSEKLVKMAMTVITALGTVLIPRNSQVIAAGDFKAFKKNVQLSMRFVFFIGLPMMFGLASIAFNITPWFFGEGYDKVPYLMVMFSTLIIIIGLSNVLGLQCLIPMKKDTKYTIAITTGAISNLILNLILIPKLFSYGACIASIVAELIVTILMFVFVRKDISFFNLIKDNRKYALASLIMFFVVALIQKYLVSSILNTLILVSIGILVYFIVLLILKDDFLYMFLQKVLNKFKIRKKKK